MTLFCVHSVLEYQQLDLPEGRGLTAPDQGNRYGESGRWNGTSITTHILPSWVTLLRVGSSLQPSASLHGSCSLWQSIWFGLLPVYSLVALHVSRVGGKRKEFPMFFVNKIHIARQHCHPLMVVLSMLSEKKMINGG